MRTILLLAICAAGAEPLKPTKEWTGTVDNEAAKAAPAVGYVAGPKEWEKLWKAWKRKEDLPKIDFVKEMVLVATSRGSEIGLTPTLDEKGDLKVRGVFSADLRSETTYLIMAIPRKGVKTYNGKALKLETKPEEP